MGENGREWEGMGWMDGDFFGKKFGMWNFFVIFAFANGLFNY